MFQVVQLRKNLPDGCTAKVVKNTLMRRASKGTDFELLSEITTGENCWVFVEGEDNLAEPIKFIGEYSKNIDKNVVSVRARHGNAATLQFGSNLVICILSWEKPRAQRAWRHKLGWYDPVSPCIFSIGILIHPHRVKRNLPHGNRLLPHANSDSSIVRAFDGGGRPGSGVSLAHVFSAVWRTPNEPFGL